MLKILDFINLPCLHENQNFNILSLHHPNFNAWLIFLFIKGTSQTCASRHPGPLPPPTKAPVLAPRSRSNVGAGYPAKPTELPVLGHGRVGSQLGTQ